MYGKDPRVEAHMRRADEQRVQDRRLGERGRHQVPPEVAEPGEVLPELPDLLDGPEQLGAQETAAVLRGAARDPEEEEKVRERGHVHADGGDRRGHDRRGHDAGQRQRGAAEPLERLGRAGRHGRHGRPERRPLLRGEQFGPRVQAVQNGPADRVHDHRRRRRQRPRPRPRRQHGTVRVP